MKVAFGSVNLDVNVSPQERERATRGTTAADGSTAMASCRLFRNILLFALALGALSGALGSCMLVMAAQSPTFNASDVSILLASLLAMASIIVYMLIKCMKDLVNGGKAEAPASPAPQSAETTATEARSIDTAAMNASAAESSETPSSETAESQAAARTTNASDFHAMSGSRAMKEHELDEVAFPPADAFSGACRTMAHRYLLSRRQTEVFYLLARGHNAAAIQTKLCISNSTAKSHISEVYKKLGIHTQRELLRMVEEAIEEVA